MLRRTVFFVLSLAACSYGSSPGPGPTPQPQPTTAKRATPRNAAPAAASPPATASQPAAINEPCEPTFVRKATEALERHRKKSGAPGAAVAVFDAGKTRVIVSGTRDRGGHRAKAILGARKLPELPARAFERTHAALFDIKGNRAIGMGWESSGKGDNERRAKNGAGSGFSSWVAFETKSKRGVAVLTNVQGGSEAPAAIGKQILEEMR